MEATIDDDQRLSSPWVLSDSTTYHIWNHNDTPPTGKLECRAEPHMEVRAGGRWREGTRQVLGKCQNEQMDLQKLSPNMADTP